MSTRLIVVIIWQYIQISNHYAVYLKVICYTSIISGFPGDSVVKNPPATAGDVRDTGLNPGSERSPEKEMAAHSSILAWRTPWTEEPGKLQSTWSQRVDTTKHACMSINIWRKKHINLFLILINTPQQSIITSLILPNNEVIQIVWSLAPKHYLKILLYINSVLSVALLSG